jgi:hypothetical protein
MLYSLGSLLADVVMIAEWFQRLMKQYCHLKDNLDQQSS